MAYFTNITAAGVSVIDEAKGYNWCRAYENNAAERAALASAYPEIFEAITGDGNLWGTAPAVTIPALPQFPDPVPTPDERMDHLEQTVDTMLGVET